MSRALHSARRPHVTGFSVRSGRSVQETRFSLTVPGLLGPGRVPPLPWASHWTNEHGIDYSSLLDAEVVVRLFDHQGGVGAGWQTGRQPGAAVGSPR